MTNKHNFSTSNASKERIRNKEVDIALEHFGTDKLAVDWLELAGVKAPTFTLLKKRRVMEPRARFIGVDKEYVIETCENEHGNNGCLWKSGDVLNMLATSRDFDQVGVFNFDTTHRFNSIKRRWTYVEAFVRRQVDHLGKFCLFCNMVGGADQDVIHRSETRLVHLVTDSLNVIPEVNIYRSDDRIVSMIHASLILSNNNNIKVISRTILILLILCNGNRSTGKSHPIVSTILQFQVIDLLLDISS